MTMSTFQTIAGLLMLGVAIALAYEFRRYMVAQSERRMTSMLKRIGLDPVLVSSGDTEAIMTEVRQRCRSCATEDVCERWLAGEDIDEFEFCPNREVFESMKEAVIRVSH